MRVWVVPRVQTSANPRMGELWDALEAAGYWALNRQLLPARDRLERLAAQLEPCDALLVQILLDVCARLEISPHTRAGWRRIQGLVRVLQPAVGARLLERLVEQLLEGERGDA